MIQDLAPGIVIYARRITKMKILMIILGMAIGLGSAFLLSIMGYIMFKYLRIIFDRIDNYFMQKELEQEEQEINDFKRNL
mgnify:CR=1 FL=1